MATNVSSSLPDLPSSHRCGSVSNHLWIPAAFPPHGRPTNTEPILKGFSVAISVTSRGGTNGSNPLSSSDESTNFRFLSRRRRISDAARRNPLDGGRQGRLERVRHRGSRLRRARSDAQRVAADERRSGV